MAFNSSIMLAESASNTRDSINEISTKTPESFIYTMLEFNDDIHSIETNERKDFYRALTEASLQQLTEADSKSISQRLSDMLHAIVEFIKKFINMITQKDIKIRNEFKHLAARSNGFINPAKDGETFMFTLHHYPKFEDIDDQKCRASLNNIISDINFICDGRDMPTTDGSSLATAYKALARICKSNTTRKMYTDPVNDNSSFAAYVRSDIIYTERKEMTYRDWHNTIKDIIPTKKESIIQKANAIKGDLEKCETRVKQANIVDPDALKNAKALISQVKAIVSSWSWYLNAIYDAETVALRYIITTYKKIRGGGSMTESGMIHGEPFDSDTLFDNEDMRDFNPTEWMDLQLTTEGFNLKFEMDEFDKQVAIKEAEIFTDDDPLKFRRLVAMREAEGKSFKETIDAIIAKIKEIINNFFSKINNTLNLNKKYVDQHMKTIKEKPFAKSTPECTSKGDILAGMARVATPIKPDPFNFDLMKDDLKDKNTFFEKRVLSKLNVNSSVSKTKVEWKNGETSVVDYCKAYFGASMPDGSCKFTGTELDASKEKIIEFVTASKSTLANIKTQMNNLESEARKVTSKSTRTQNADETADKSTEGEKKEEAKNESMYYSSLYGRYLTEVEITSGELTPQEAGSEGDSSSNESAAFKVYYEVYKDVLMSELTATEFIISELMKIIHHHVDFYSGKGKKQPKQEEKKEEAK